MKKNNFIQFICVALFSLSVYVSSYAANTIVIDDLRNLNVNANTTLTIDRRTVPQTEGLEQYGTGFLSRTLPGFKANINYSAGSSPNGGELNNINLINSVIGPVTVNNETTFQVLLVDLVIDADTVIEGIANIGDVTVGSIVAASGIESETGAIRATRIEVLQNGSHYWLMTGDVVNLNKSGFGIGSQHLNFISTQDNVFCENQVFVNGDKVIADITPIENYTTGDVVDALAVICFDDFTFPIDPPNPVFFNGLIESINVDQTGIVVNGTPVTINANTEIFSNTGVSVLEVGMDVSINGYEDPISNEAIASFIFINDEPVLPPPLPFIVEGLVSNVTSVDFELEGMVIAFNEQTIYIEGTVADLVDGVVIEAIIYTDTQQPAVFTAMQINFNPQSPPGQSVINVVGQISNLSADHLNFTLANEAIELSGTTLFVGTTLLEITQGQEVTVEGIRNPISQVITASLLSNGVIGPIPHVCVSGTITQVNADQTQVTLESGSVINVNSDTVYIEGTQADLIVGRNVDVSGTTNNATSEIDAEVVFFVQIAPPSGVFFTDFINSISVDKTQLTVGDTVVNIVAATQIIGGNIDDLVVGLEVQIDGVLNAQTSEVDAESIALPVKFVSAQAPVIASDVTLSDPGAFNGKVLVLGIEVNQNELTVDPSGLFVNGLAGNDLVVFYGYEDAAGDIWASVVYPLVIETTPNGTTTFFIDGDVTAVSSNYLEVMGVTIGNLNNAAFYNANFELMTQAEFLNAVSVGDSITVSDAESYDRTTNTLNAGSLYLTGQYSNNKNTSAAKAASGNVNGRGIITSFIEDGLVFISGFE